MTIEQMNDLNARVKSICEEFGCMGGILMLSQGSEVHLGGAHLTDQGERRNARLMQALETGLAAADSIAEIAVATVLDGQVIGPAKTVWKN